MKKKYTLQSVGQSVDNLTKTVNGNAQGITSLTKSVEILVETVGHILMDQTEMKEDISILKGDVSGLKGDVSGLKGDVSGLKGDVSGLKGDVSELRNDMATVKTHLNKHDKRFDAQDDTLAHHSVWLQGLREDNQLILPNHEVRINKLEKTAAS